MSGSVYYYAGCGILAVFCLYLMGLLFGGDFVFLLLIGIAVGLLAYFAKKYDFVKDEWKDCD